MASIERLERALRNAHNANDVEAAKKFASEIRRQQKVTPSSGVMDTFNSFSDAAGTMISNVGGAIAGNTYGFGKGIYNAVQDGTYGTQRGVQTVRDTIDEVTDQFSKGDAYTPGGQDMLDSAAEAIQPVSEAVMDFDRDARILEPLSMMPGSPLAPAYRAMAVSAGAPVAARNAVRATGQAATAPVRGAQRALNRVTEPPANSRSVGAAETDIARQRIATSQGTPIPFQGDSGLTRGQATREAEQLRFENEAARDGNMEIQDRRRNQQVVANQNFDAMDEDIDPPRFGSREEQGAAIRSSLQEYKGRRKLEKDAAYAAARAAGETEQLIPQISGLNRTLQEAWRYRHNNKGNEAIWTAAKEMEIVDGDGNLKPLTIHQAEEFRKMVNQTYDGSVPQEAMWRRQFIDVIDKTLDGVPAGAKYKEARGIARDYYDEFENSPLARDMDKNIRGTNADRVADEKISQRVAGSSIQQIRQLQNTLSSSGDKGVQTWKAIQSDFLGDIRRSAFGTVGTDVTGTPTLTASKFKNKVRDLDESGKLEAILGKEQAQQIRDLVEVADAIATSPPQIVNPGTGSEIFKRLKELAPKGLFGGAMGLEYLGTGGVPVFSYGAKLAADAAKSKKVAKSLDGQSLLEGL